VHGQNQHAGLGSNFFQLGQGGQAIQIGHGHVEQDNVWLEFYCLLNRLLAGIGLAHHMHVSFCAEEHPQTGPQDGVIVGQQQAE
jgi:hypothetical protein